MGTAALGSVRFRIAALVVTLVTVAGLVPALTDSAAASLPSGYRLNDYADGQAMSILPPGENGLTNAADAVLWELNKTRPANSQSQLAQYNNLLYGYPTLTDATLGSYYNDESFGVQAANITRTETPESGLVIYRDKLDIPHIYGDTDSTAAFGAGYAQAEDRLFLMDVLRHYGEGTLAQFLGGSCAFEQMDHDQLLLSAYTPTQAQAQVDNLPAEYGATGTQAKTMIYSYVAGVNAYISLALRNAKYLPADYAAAAPTLLPTKWKVGDVVAIAGLIGGIFGRGGGNEVANSALYTYLLQKMGTVAGTAAYHRLTTSNDLLAPTTADVPFPYEIPGTVDPTTTAIPDHTSLTGGPVDTDPNCNLAQPNVEGLGIIAALNALPKHMSNALVVNASHSADGHPIAVFGPQVGYFTPQILSQLDIHAPDYDAEGASFPGTGLVELGRGEDYAWSATSAGSDLIDQRLEQICNPAGGTPAANGTSYLYNGVCTPMTKETFVETALTKINGQGAPVRLTHTIYLTVHGIVQGWTTSGGAPVAVVNQRSTYFHDVDSVVGFLGFANPATVHDVSSWMSAANQILYTFNWFYVDANDTGYFVSGLDPIRPSNVDPTLPTWGTGGSEWQGFLTQNQHVHEVNSPQGFFVSWNNKPAPQFAAADDQFGYGQVYRSQMLVDQLTAQFAAHGGLVTRSEVVQAMETAASQDQDGLTVLATLLQYLHHRNEPARVVAMLNTLSAWIANGAHRHKAQPGDTQYSDAAAVAIADEVYPDLIHALYDSIFAAGGMSGSGPLTSRYNVVPLGWVDAPNGGGTHHGSSYDGGFESYLMTSLEQLMGQTPADAFGPEITSLECGTGPAACPAAIDAALAAAYQSLVTANGGSTNVAGWTASTASAAAGQAMPVFDAIQFQALGLITQPAIDWQNRPTFQQVIEFPRHR